MQERPLKKRNKGLSIFLKFFLSYLGVGIIVVVITAGQYWLNEQRAIKEELKSEFRGSLRSAIAYFDKTYSSRITEDLRFIDASHIFNSYLSSQKDEIPLAKSLSEQLLLQFTGKDKGIFLSARFIDAKGEERIVTIGGKRSREYLSLDTLPAGDTFYPRVRALFNRLRSAAPGTILFEGPFEFDGKFTFLAGISKSEPEVGGNAGAVIFHCDLTDYFNHLDGYVFYNEHVARVFTLGDKLIFASEQNKPLLQGRPRLLAGERPASFYQLAENIWVGSDNQLFFKLVMSISPEIFDMKSRAVFNNLLIFIALIMVLVALPALVMSKYFLKPLAGLIGSANRLAKGDLSARVEIKAGGEMGLLVDSFNNMAEDLQKTTVSRDILVREVAERKKAEGSLRESENYLKTIFNSLQIGIILIDAETHLIVDANPVAVSLFGAPSEKIIGSLCHNFICPAEKGKCPITDLQQDVDNAERVLITADGERLAVIKTVVCVTLKNRKFLLESFVDISGRKKLEEERERLIRELEDSRRAIKNVADDLMQSKTLLEYQNKSLEEINKELDDFTYIVSHDLKEPLRSIDAYSKFVADDYRGKLSAEGMHYLERIRSNAERMKNLIEDLLEISRLKRKGSLIEEVEAEELIAEVKTRLEYAIREKGAEIVIKDKLPRIFCDRVRFTEVFLNLISNAVKFNDKPKPVIEIGYLDQGTLHEFYVKDNGIGIEEKYFEKIFEIFQRLGKREDAEGTGAGLTIVKKIIQMHRGKIWLESRRGEGAVFHFAIPKEKSDILGKKLIGEILIEEKIATEEEIKKALEKQKKLFHKGGDDGGSAQDHQDTAG
ncbi:MAG: ATP-binding protein [Candidatus Omnitrophota bacterium]